MPTAENPDPGIGQSTCSKNILVERCAIKQRSQFSNSRTRLSSGPFQPKSALAGVWLVFGDAARFVLAYVNRASEHFYCPAERLIQVRRRASDNASFL
jgi:hypothetical protein